MTDTAFDHDKLDVYRLSITYVADSFRIAKGLSGLHRHAREQWLRAAQSIPLNIAEGNGKRSLRDRSRFFDIARGSALECAATQDVLAVSGGIDDVANRQGKEQLKRIVAMLTKLGQRADAGAQFSSSSSSHGNVEHEHEHDYEYEYEHEHRCAEHEH